MTWIQVAEDLQTLDEGKMHRVRIGDYWIVLVQIAGTIYAFDDNCTHMQESLSEGDLDGYVVYCPLHLSGFDIRTGQVLSPPAETELAVYPVKLEEQKVWVAIP